MVSNAFNKLKSLFMGPSEAVSETMEERKSTQYETDEDGKTIEMVSADGKTKTKLKTGKYGEFMKASLTTVTTSFTSPMVDMTKAAEEWEKKDAPWLKGNNKGKTIGDWIGNALSGFWKTITGNVESFVSGGESSGTGAGRNTGYGGPDLKKSRVGSSMKRGKIGRAHV